jgi:hypothetical protein
LFTEETRLLDGVPAMKWSRRLALRLNAGGEVNLQRFYPATFAAEAGRVADTARAFLDDAGAVLARSHDHCCICGKVVTDERSKARGIGPECIRYAPSWFYAEQAALKQFIAPDLSAGALAS